MRDNGRERQRGREREGPAAMLGRAQAGGRSLRGVSMMIAPPGEGQAFSLERGERGLSGEERQQQAAVMAARTAIVDDEAEVVTGR